MKSAELHSLSWEILRVDLVWIIHKRIPYCYLIGLRLWKTSSPSGNYAQLRYMFVFCFTLCMILMESHSSTQIVNREEVIRRWRSSRWKYLTCFEMLVGKIWFFQKEKKNEEREKNALSHRQITLMQCNLHYGSSWAFFIGKENKFFAYLF